MVSCTKVLLGILFSCVSNTEDLLKHGTDQTSAPTPFTHHEFLWGDLALATHRVWVLAGRLGIRWSSLQVTLKSSSWWHSQGGDSHPLPRRLLGRASSRVSSSRDPGLIFQGTSYATSSLCPVATFSVPCVWCWKRPGCGRVREGGGGLQGAVTSSLESTLERGKERFSSAPLA